MGPKKRIPFLRGQTRKGIRISRCWRAMGQTMQKGNPDFEVLAGNGARPERESGFRGGRAMGPGARPERESGFRGAGRQWARKADSLSPGPDQKGNPDFEVLAGNGARKADSLSPGPDQKGNPDFEVLAGNGPERCWRAMEKRIPFLRGWRAMGPETFSGARPERESGFQGAGGQWSPKSGFFFCEAEPERESGFRGAGPDQKGNPDFEVLAGNGARKADSLSPGPERESGFRGSGGQWGPKSGFPFSGARPERESGFRGAGGQWGPKSGFPFSGARPEKESGF